MDTHSSHHGNQTGKIEFQKHFVLPCSKDNHFAQPFFWRKTRTPPTKLPSIFGDQGTHVLIHQQETIRVRMKTTGTHPTLW